jgi:tRNA-dihydrouridine synthase 2
MSLTLSLQEQASKLYSGELLAPMVRASTTPLRALALKYGADACYTEELVDRALLATIRVENKELGTIDYVKDTKNMSAKTVKKMGCIAPVLLRIDPAIERGKLICQLGSGEPELALKAALHVCRDVDAIDLNMGCPKKFSVSGGMGAALLLDLDRSCRIVKTLQEHLKIPVSVKIRLLKTVETTVDFITALIDAGAKAVAIHGRHAGDESVNPAFWDELRDVVCMAKARHPTTPILINGDFYTRQEFVDFQQATGADGVLLARPALYNTSLFRKPLDSAVHSYNSTLLLDKTQVIQEYLRLAVRYNIHYRNVKYVVCEMMSHRRTPPGRTPQMPIVLKVRSSEETTKTLQSPAGEHTYSDSYLLEHETKNLNEASCEQAPSKKAKIEALA